MMSATKIVQNGSAPPNKGAARALDDKHLLLDHWFKFKIFYGDVTHDIRYQKDLGQFPIQSAQILTACG